MVQPGEGTGLPSKPSAGLRALDETLRQDLERHVALQPDVSGVIDDTHAPLPDPPDDSKMGNLLPDQGIHGMASSGAIRGRFGALPAELCSLSAWWAVSDSNQRLPA